MFKKDTKRDRKDKNFQNTTERAYHLLQKGANNSRIFFDNSDYLRFVYDLFVFNNQKKLKSVGYYFFKDFNKISLSDNYLFEKSIKPLVNILAFVVMPTHFHLILKATKKRNISLFMQKLCAGYALYFNKKYKRNGVVFNGRYKVVLLKNKFYLSNLLHYVHAKPLHLKSFCKSNYKNSFDFLKNYRWSSYIDYCGWNNFPKVIKKEFLFDFFNGPENYKKKFEVWVNNLNLSFDQIAHLTLEENNKSSFL